MFLFFKSDLSFFLFIFVWICYVSFMGTKLFQKQNQNMEDHLESIF